MEGGIRASEGPMKSTSFAETGTQGSATPRKSARPVPSFIADGKRSLRQSGKNLVVRTKYAALNTISNYMAKVAAVSDLDDEAKKLGDLSDLGQESQEGLTGEERLMRVTTKEGMKGLLKFTQHGSTKDIRKVGVSPEILTRVVIEDEWQLMSCMQLPLTVIFFFMFMLFFQQHYGTSYIHLQESNLRGAFGDAAWEVNDIEGIYSWFKESLFAYAYSTDTSFQNNPSWQSDLEGSEYQEWVAGLLIRTQRAEIMPCDSDVVKDFNCTYMTIGSKLGKVETQGTNLQQLPNGGDKVGGWDLTERRLKAIAEGRLIPQNETWSEAFYGPRGQPTTRIEWLAHKLTSWFPKQKTFKRVGKWIKLDDSKQKKPVSRETAEMVEPKASRASPEAVAQKLASLRNQKEVEGKKKKGSKKKRKKMSVKKMNRKKGRKLEGVYPAPRRLDDVVVKEDPSKKENKVYRENDGVNEPRQLRQTRTEFSLGGWIPYPYVTTDVWEYVMPVSLPQDQANALLDAWQADELITRSTLFFGVEIMFRNPTMPESGLLTHSFINFIFSRGGHIYVEVTMQSLVLSNARMSVMGFAFIWIGALTVNSISTPARLCTAFKRGGFSAVWTHMKRSWNLLEWFLIFVGWVIVVSFLAERYGMMKFADHWEDYLDGRTQLWRAQNSDPAENLALQDYDRDWFEEMHKNIMNTGNIDVWLQVIVAHYHNFLIWRFFIASRGQPRLAMYLKTIFDAATDLAHLGIVIMIIFIAYVVSGHILLGRRMESFATIEGSLAYCIQIILQKEFDYQTLTMQDFWTVSVWVWSFVVLIVLVLVNMVLAMIFDTYADVRNNLNEGDSMFSTLRTIFKQVKLYNVWVSNSDLVMAVKKLKGEQVTAGRLREQVPGISNVQMQHLFDAAKVKLETLMIKGNKNALPEAVATILIGVDELKAGVKIMSGAAPQPRESGIGESFEDEEPAPRPSAVEAPDGSPLWLKNGLLPHLRRQEKFMDQVHAEIQGIDQKIKSKGVGAGLPDTPFEDPGAPWDDKTQINEPDLKLKAVEEVTMRLNNIVSQPPTSSLSGAGKQGRLLEGA